MSARRILLATPLAFGILSTLFALGVGYYAAATNTTDGGLVNVLWVSGTTGVALIIVGFGIIGCCLDCGEW